MEKDNRLNTLGQIKALTGVSHGSCSEWFAPATMQWFRCRVSENVYPTGLTEAGTYFVTSERDAYASTGGSRRYTVRQARLRENEIGVYATITTPDQRGQEGFGYFKSLSGAHAAAKRMRDAAVAESEKRGDMLPL